MITDDSIKVDDEIFEVDILELTGYFWLLYVELNHPIALMHVYGALVLKIKGIMVKSCG